MTNVSQEAALPGRELNIGKLKKEYLWPWECWQWLIMAGPIDPRRLRNVLLHDEVNSLKTPEEIIRFLERRRTESKEFLSGSEFEGFSSTVATMLAQRYREFLGDTRAFVICHYDMIVAHIFTAPEKLPEHKIKTIGSAGSMYHLSSILTVIAYNLRAMHMYTGASYLGRRKFLTFCYFPFVDEVFRGLEYLARLHAVAIKATGAKNRFANFLINYSGLAPELVNALWEFRCGIVHRGTLYNVSRTGIFRFGFAMSDTKKGPIWADKSSSEHFLEGTHYQVSGAGLHALFLMGVEYVYTDMRTMPAKYALNPNFHDWIRTSWTQQYLLSGADIERMNRPMEPSLDAVVTKLQAMNASGMEVWPALVKRNKWKAGKASRARWVEDLVSRMRDVFAP